MIAAWIALGILVPVLDVRWWVGVVVALAIPALAAALSYLLVDLGVLALFVHQGRAALEGLRTTASVAVRALPPLLAVTRNREEFLDDELERVGRVMAARAYYRGALGRGEGSPERGA